MGVYRPAGHSAETERPTLQLRALLESNRRKAGVGKRARFGAAKILETSDEPAMAVNAAAKRKEAGAEA